VSQREIMKNSLEANYFGAQARSRSSMFTPLESSVMSQYRTKPGLHFVDFLHCITGLPCHCRQTS